MSSDNISKKQQKFQERLQRSKQEKRKKQAKNLVLILVGLGIIISAMIIQAQKPITDLIEPSPKNHPMADGHSLGDPNAPITVEVYSDFKCAACEYFFASVEPILVQEYVQPGLVYYVYHTFGDIIHPPQSGITAQAAFCAEDQGAFWDFHDYLFTNFDFGMTQGFSDKAFETIADLIGIDKVLLTECIASDTHKDATNNDASEGIALGVPGTPGVIINGVLLDGFQFSDIQNAVDSLLDGESQEN